MDSTLKMIHKSWFIPNKFYPLFKGQFHLTFAMKPV